MSKVGVSALMHCAQWSVPRGLFIGIALFGGVFSTAAVGLPPGQTLADAAFGDGAFVSVGTRGTIVSSINGGPWEPRTSGTTNDLQAVAHGNGIFVAAGASGTLLSSSNGIDWVVRGTGGAWSKPEIAYGNGLFVVATKGAGAVWTMLVSSNAVDWTAINVDAIGPQNSSLPFGSIAFGEGRFLAIGGLHGTSMVVTSTDGLIWREQGANIPRASSAVTGPITYGNGKFAMVVSNVSDDDDDGGYFDHVLLSEDGVFWQGSSFGAVDVPALLAADCAFVAATSYFTPNNIAYTRGSFWWTNIALPIAMSVNALAYGNGKFFAFGSEIMEFVVPSFSGFAANPPVQEVPSGSYAYFWADPPVCPDPPVTLQWRHNGVPIPGETNAWLQLFAVATNHAGAYTLIAMNGAGLSATSSVAMLIVTNYPDPDPSPPELFSPSTNHVKLMALGSEDALNPGAVGWPYPTFQWRQNGVDIPGATNQYLNFFSVDSRAAGDYTLVARNPSGVATSAVITVVLTNPPLSFAGVELSQGVLEGSDAQFNWDQNAGGTADATYFVLKNGTNAFLPLSFGNLILPEVSLADAGQYLIMASNSVNVRTGLVATLNVIPGGQLDRWTRRNPLPHNDTLLEVAHGNGRFVAVGERGAVVVSTNGTDWVLDRVKGQPTLSSVAYGNGAFVGVAQGTILSSIDGVTWAARMNRRPSWVEFRTVHFGNGRFVAAGGTKIFTSTDGVNWDPATLPTHQPPILRAIAFGNGMFVAISEFLPGTRAWTSADGVTWAPVANGPGQEIEDLTFGNGLFVAVGDEGAVYTSANGTNWTSRDSDVSNRLIDVIYGNGRFVAVGTRGRIISSANGTSWRRETSGTPDRLESITFAGGTFTAVGENCTILSSPNGVDWTKRNYGVTRDLDGIALGNGTIAVVGKGGSIMTSTDGSNFIQRASGTVNDLHGISWADNLFVAVGEPETIVTSPDAVQWTVRRLGTNSSLKAVAKGNGLWVAVGTGGAVLTSTDAATWVRQESYTLNDLNSVAYGNGVFVAVGDNLPPNGTMITSLDGITWTRRNQYIGKNLRAVAFANGTFVATGNDGSILASSNGLAWTPASTLFYGNYAFNLRAITYAAGTWVIVGNEGLVLTSPNLQDWLVRVRQGIDNLHGVVALDDKFVAIGNRGTILQSEIYSPVGPTLRGRFLGHGVELTVTGDLGTSVTFQHSPSLTGPWTPFNSYSFTPGSTTIVMFDPTPTNSNTRFYRAVPR
jgi:hypothetical protein